MVSCSLIVYPMFNCRRNKNNRRGHPCPMDTFSSSIYLSVCLSACLPACLSVCLSVCLSIYPSIFLFNNQTYIPFWKICDRNLSIYLSIYLFIYLSIYLSMKNILTDFKNATPLISCYSCNCCKNRITSY